MKIHDILFRGYQNWWEILSTIQYTKKYHIPLIAKKVNYSLVMKNCAFISKNDSIHSNKGQKQ